MVFLSRTKAFSILIFLCFLIGSWHISRAEDTTVIHIKYPFSSLKTDYEIKIEKNWLHEGRPLNVPFKLEIIDEARVSNQFQLPDSLTEQLYLYIDRASWNVEVELNGHYLGLNEDTYKPYIIKLEEAWLKKGQNDLVLTLVKGESCYLCPKQLLGIYEPIYVLNKTQLSNIQRKFLPEVQTADTVALVAPYYRRKGFAFDTFESVRTLLPLLPTSVRHIYFPFEPDRKFEALCAQYGFTRVKELSEETIICPINFYPYEPAEFPWTFSFWLNGNGRRNFEYGNFYPASDYLSNARPDSNRLLIVLMLLYPLVVFMIVKLLSPGFYHSQAGLLLNPQLFVDSSFNTSETQQGWVLLLQLFRMVGISIFITLSMYYIRITHQWEMINLFRDSSLLEQVFYGEYSLPGLFLRSFGIVLGWFLIKHAVITLIGIAFGIKGMLEGAMNLDIIGSYPIIILLPVPAALLLFWGGSYPKLMMMILVISGLIYLSRKVYVLFLGLNRLFGFPSTMKFLYICTFNIFPYMFWL